MVVPSQRWAYRDRVCLHAQHQDGHWQFGLRVRDEIIDIPHCPVHSQRVQDTMALLRRTLPAMPLAYVVQAGAQLTLVLKSHQRPPLDWLDADCRQGFEDIGVEGLWLHHNPAAGRRLFIKRGWQLLHGQPRSQDNDGLWYGPAAFQQPIEALARQARAQATAWLQPNPERPVLDLYCGRGSSLRDWLAHGADCLGVELAGEAVACAQENAPQATVLQGSCATRLPQIQHWWQQQAFPPVLYANPPRTGLEPPLRDWLIRYGRPTRLAYLSCSAGTLSRDLAAFEAAGYHIVALQPYDFFPRTQHVETLALLQRW